MAEAEEEHVQPERKRRLSRKEQKARKKNKKNTLASTASGTVATAPTTTTRDKLIPTKLAKEETTPTVEDDTPAVDKETTATAEKTSAPQEQPDEPEPDYLSDYEPIPIPEATSSNASSLGKWFPKAKVIKSAVTYSNDSKSKSKASLVLFYQYATWSEYKVDQLLAYLSKIAEVRQTLGGRIRVAPEGVNATVSSVDREGDIGSSQRQLRHFCEDLKRFDTVFQSTDFKFIDGVSPDRHFKDLKLLPVKELVFYGIKDGEAPLKAGGTHVDARGFHSLLEQESTVVIDVRNHYEAAIGRFNGQEQTKVGDGVAAADYIDPKMRKSTDFPAWLERPETKEKLQNKTVLMYCTGGVRCERASAYLNTKMGSDVKGIFQLQGGIERYLKAFPDGGHWRGKNFVFDKREAISADNPDGDGGVIPSRKDLAKAAAAAAESKETACCVCDKAWDRYLGKKKCTMCGVPVLMCNTCMSTTKKDSILRCPLCVEEDITVPAADVQYTDNGVSGRPQNSSKDGEKKGKAASSVLKWGGGHAHGKKEKQKDKRRKNKLKTRTCQNGKDCTRPDCFFFHPGRDESNKANS
jgi:predicted sulfurtransferase